MSSFTYRYENEQPFRKAAEEEINSLYKVIDEANSTKKDLESQIESLKEELGFLSRSYEEVGGGLTCRAELHNTGDAPRHLPRAAGKMPVKYSQLLVMGEVTLSFKLKWLQGPGRYINGEAAGPSSSE